MHATGSRRQTRSLRVVGSSRRSGERGAVAIEFALILPLLVLLLFGIIQFSIVYNRNQALHAAAREGARVGALPQTTVGEVHSRVEDALAGVIDPSETTISVDPGAGKPCDLRQGEKVTVTVQYPYTIAIPLWGEQNVNLEGKGEFRCE